MPRRGGIAIAKVDIAALLALVAATVLVRGEAAAMAADGNDQPTSPDPDMEPLLLF
ncbi:MAG TPA: hypothetical protein VG187_05390 [Mycobacterium sp.]|nr:hypothetical protein [Mycobacterium sp.]